MSYRFSQVNCFNLQDPQTRSSDDAVSLDTRGICSVTLVTAETLHECDSLVKTEREHLVLPQGAPRLQYTCALGSESLAPSGGCLLAPNVSL